MLKTLAAAGASTALALAAAAPVTAAGPRASSHVQKVSIVILQGDRASPANIALAPGVPIRITVTNYTREVHTFTAPGLGLSEVILPARPHSPSKTTFSFTPRQGGSFAWRCLVCPTGLHGRPHAMGGLVYLIVDPSALP